MSRVKLRGSSPESLRIGSRCGGTRGGMPSTASATAEMCAGVVPQQPPTMLTKPLAANSPSTDDVSTGPSS